MDNIQLRMKLEDEQQGAYPMPSAFNTLDQQSTTDHHPHQQSRQFLSKKEEERPTCDTGVGQHTFERNKQQQLHSISNNFSVNTKCDPSSFSVSSTSSSVVEQQQKKEKEVIENPENQTVQHHHHHHHHHYHSHYYNYYSNTK